MASAVVCDKCGISGTNTSKFMHVRGHRLANATEFKANAEDHIDVCKECYNKIFNKEDIN